MNLNSLNVSLTKHGAHKISVLLKNFDIKNVLLHFNDPMLRIDIDGAQARKNLNVFSDSNLPRYWDQIRLRQDLNIYVLLSIIFSHHSLISAMLFSKNRFGRGIILRDEIVEGKAYTNIANNFEELGFIVTHNESMFEYDISYVFTNEFNLDYLRKIILDKFIYIGMKEEEFEKELIENKIYGVFGLTELEFQSWFFSGQISAVVQADDSWGEVYSETETPFKFVPRHIERKSTPIKISSKTGPVEMNQLHAKIQNELYKKLAGESGLQNIGTEIQVNYQNKIDLVQKDSTSYIFYEIKTHKRDRQNIREALSQLLEYAYWPDKERCHSLVIVAPAKLSDNGIKYLIFLRNKFGIPVMYLWYNEKTNEFIPQL